MVALSPAPFLTPRYCLSTASSPLLPCPFLRRRRQRSSSPLQLERLRHSLGVLRHPPRVSPSQPFIVRSQFQSSCSLISPRDHWGSWSALLAIAAFGLWSEKTKIGSIVSGALVSILVGLTTSNLGILPHEAPAYSVVFEFLLPLTVPLLLFRANLYKLFRVTGKLMLAFLLGSVATTIGTVVAYLLVPMKSLGQDSWKIAAALMGSYIGGAVNYVAISESLGTSPSIMAAGVAADNVICAIYFVVLFGLASRVPPETSVNTDAVMGSEEGCSGSKTSVVQTAASISVAFAMCKCATYVTQLFKIQGGVLPAVTAIVIFLATAFPKVFSHLAPSAESVSLILMQIFFAVLGASGSIWNVINTTPSIFMFAFVQVTTHLVVALGLGRVFSLELKLLLLASNANVGGPTTACGMAKAQGWDTLIVPAVLAGIFGMSIATFLGIGFGVSVLKYM